ncbi:tetratricopeptide repeat protein [Lederbergia lenta]|uniref:DNA binding protein n=1 Tax=Lederbergia lenta TaxID=1467 RepID=A0A2X4WAY9_LEDLE|nr:tetratricopeptide repeat protein [Lederbergia lenta]MEC2322789.1 tetratricopeptide repeat protein [Lederbergia lenta]SQI61857.1 DNA binding protein [Lederbergia lenta]
MFKETKLQYEKSNIFPFVPTGEYYYHKGIKAYDRYDIKKAKKYLIRAWELEPDEPMIACQLALIYTDDAEYAESNELLHTVLKDLDERMTECHYFLANNYAHLGLFTEAYKHAHLYLDLDQTGEFAEDTEELLALMGINEDENIDELEEQELMANQQEAARQLLEAGNFMQAIEMLEEAVETHPEFWPAYNNLALAYFYEGETGKAFGILEKVLDQNPGNLHALCNLVIFLYYERKDEELDTLLSALEKVQPISMEHRYKLGATFALAGKYDKAYYLLRHIQKHGYEGDAGFYYWLARAAHFTGNHTTAERAWKQLAVMNPNKAGTEPWKEAQQIYVKLEDEDTFIMKLLNSDRLEERLYGIFLIGVSKHKKELITHDEFKPLDDFSLTEKIYLAVINQSNTKEKIDPDGLVEKGHEIALKLYRQFDSDRTKASGIILAWFSTFRHALKIGAVFTNTTAIAAAMEYTWLRDKENKKTQKEIADEYDLSQSTVRKYIHILENNWK